MPWHWRRNQGGGQGGHVPPTHTFQSGGGHVPPPHTHTLFRVGGQRYVCAPPPHTHTHFQTQNLGLGIEPTDICDVTLSLWRGLHHGVGPEPIK